MTHGLRVYDNNNNVMFDSSDVVMRSIYTTIVSGGDSGSIILMTFTDDECAAFDYADDVKSYMYGGTLSGTAEGFDEVNDILTSTSGVDEWSDDDKEVIEEVLGITITSGTTYSGVVDEYNSDLSVWHDNTYNSLVTIVSGAKSLEYDNTFGDDYEVFPPPQKGRKSTFNKEDLIEVDLRDFIPKGKP